MQRPSNVPAAPYVLATMPIDPDQTATIVTSRGHPCRPRAGFRTLGGGLSRHARRAGVSGRDPAWSDRRLSALALSLRRSSAAESWHDSPKMRAHVAIADRFSTALRQLEVGDGVRSSAERCECWQVEAVRDDMADSVPVCLSSGMLVRTALKDAPLPLQLLPRLCYSPRPCSG